MLAPTPDRVAITGRATVESGVWRLATSTEVVYAQLGRPVGGRSPQSPREHGQVWLRYPMGALTLGPPAPGSTLTVNGVAYEVCENAGFLTQGTRDVGHELKIVQYTVAYPTAVDIRDSAGGAVAAGEIARWAPRESHDSLGERVDERGEAPASLYDSLVPRNTTVGVGDQTWRVTACTLDLDEGRVQLGLRNTRGQD